MIKEIEKKLDAIEKELEQTAECADSEAQLRRHELEGEKNSLLKACKNLPPEDKVYLARRAGRPSTVDYIEGLFTNFFEQRGDRHGREDPAILGGIALYKGTPVTVIGHRKGKNLEENKAFNFGMPGPEGYRKAQRLMKQAEKFGRPIITFVDTSGAYPGLEAEAFGQGEAIASSLALMSRINVPIITVVIGEGGSGGALALAMGNKILMLENAVYSVLSPEGFSSILWRDSSKIDEACRIMKLTAQDLFELGVIDEIIPEPLGGAHRNPKAAMLFVDLAITNALKQMKKVSQPAAHRYKKFRNMGNFSLIASRKEGPCKD